MVTRKNQQRVTVRNLTQYGVNTDVEPFELPVNAFTEAINMSFRGGKVSKSSGYHEIMKPSEDEVLKLHSKSGYVYYGTEDRIKVFNGATHNDLSKGGNRIELTVMGDNNPDATDYSIHLKSGVVEQTFTYTSSKNPGTYLLGRAYSSTAFETKAQVAFSLHGLRWETELPKVTPAVYTGGLTLLAKAVVEDNCTVTYAWFKDGVKLDGETSSTLSLKDVRTNNTYKCTASVSTCNDKPSTSISTETKVELPLKWSLEMPTNISKNYGEVVDLRVLATGADNITYQWFVDGEEVTGAINPAYTTDALERSTTIRVEATAGSVEIDDSTRILVDVGTNLVFTAPLKRSYTIKEGVELDLGVEAVGYGDITYAWFKRSEGDTSWVEITGETTNRLKITGLKVATDYKCTATAGSTSKDTSTTVEVIKWEPDTKQEILEGLLDKIEGLDSLMRNLVEAVVIAPIGEEPKLVITRTAATDVMASNPVKLNMLSEETNHYTPFTGWATTELSNVIVFSNIANKPQYKAPTTYGFLDLPAWDDKWATPRIRAYKSFLLAMSTMESGIEYPQRIRWSDIAYPNEPPLSWDATSTTNSAGFNDLSEARGTIVDGLPMGDSFVIYTDEEVFLMDYAGGSSIFRFRRAEFAVSILAPECVVAAKGGHVVMTKDDVVYHQGVSPVSIADNKVRERLFNSIGKDNYEYVRMVYLAPKDEVWIYYPLADSADLRAKTEVAIYNLSNQTWTFRQILPTFDLHFGVTPAVGTDIIDDQDILIDDFVEVIDGYGKDFRDGTLLGSTFDKRFMVFDEGATADGKTQAAYLERRYIDFDSVGMSSDSMKYVSGIRPQISGSGQVYIKVGSSATPQANVEWSEPVIFDIAEDYKADVTINGRYISVRFEVLDDSEVTLTGYDIDVSERSRR